MNTYSQNREDLFIANYFGNFKGNLFDIGANNGVDFSNSLALIENDWNAHLFEPSSAFTKLYELHKDNIKVRLNDCGLSDKSETVVFWESANHVPNGKDYGLVSTAIFDETKRWPNVTFIQKEIRLISFNDYYKWIGEPAVDFISLDVEGMEFKILSQIDLNKIQCKVICIEWNSDPSLLKLYTDYCKGFKVAVRNAENLIFCR